MLNVSIPRRYARALLLAAGDSSSFDKILAQLDELLNVFKQSPELTALAEHPGYSRSDRAAAVEVLLKAAGEVDPLLANLLRLLVQRDRLQYLPDITRLFRDFVDAHSGRVRGHLTTATPLPEQVLRKVQANLEQLTRRHVLLESRVDPALLGGAAAQVGSTLYDGSLRSQLEGLRRELKER